MASNFNASLAVVIPMHNEEGGARRCVAAVMPCLNKLGVPASLIVVDDGSKDKTAQILTELTLKWPGKLIVVTHKTNLGYGAGLATGVKKAGALGFDHVVFMDSDLTNNPKDLNKFVAKMDYDLVKASRYRRGGQVVGVSFKRRSVSMVGNLVCRLCFRMGLTDYTNGFRMVKTKRLVNYQYREKGFAIILEEMYRFKQLKVRCSEIPVTLSTRTNTKSQFHYSLPQLWAYFKYALKALAVI